MHNPTRALSAIAAGSLCLYILAGCATRPKPDMPAPPPEPLPVARIEPGAPRFTDQNRLSLPFALVLSNSGSETLRVESVAYSLAIDGSKAPLESVQKPDYPLPRGGEASLSVEFPVDVRELDEAVAGPGGPARAGWRLEARLRLSGEAGAPTELAATAVGSFPIVREPRFRISYIGIGRDILVVTNLRIGLEIENPNAFPLVFRSMDYKFHGEGKYWAEGSSAEETFLPALSATSLVLDGTMNFANMDRRLFDLVATLQTVNYRLKGETRIATELDFLPAFEARCDESGSCAVQR